MGSGGESRVSVVRLLFYFRGGEIKRRPARAQWRKKEERLFVISPWCGGDSYYSPKAERFGGASSPLLHF